MADLLLWLISGFVLLAWVVRALQFRQYGRTALRLDRAPADGEEALPPLSVVVPARDEEATVGEAMRTLLALAYPDLEIIAVDDRSTDRTGAILDSLAAEDPRLRVVRVRELPPGWIGKNHALHLGGLRARGEYILFTDADVHFEPTALRRAVRAARRRDLDHLVVLPDVRLEGFWETALVTYFAVAFQFAFLPWQIADPRSKAYVGVGAFNLVRAAAYQRAGGHAALPMDVLDDVKLGKRLKEAGGRQACGFGEGMVRVRWAVGARGVIRGLDKNAFAVFGFRPGPVVVSIGMVLLLVVWPGAGLFVGPWGARLLCAGTLASMAWIVRMIPPAPGVSPLYGLCFPAAALLFAYAILRSMVGAYRRGGVVWRGTLYPLADLRRGVV